MDLLRCDYYQSLYQSVHKNLENRNFAKKKNVEALQTMPMSEILYICMKMVVLSPGLRDTQTCAVAFYLILFEKNWLIGKRNSAFLNDSVFFYQFPSHSMLQILQ